MAVASTPTKLPLATFARILGLHPLHFEGIQFTPNDRSPNLCESALMQYAWQETDRVAREDIARAIADAEAMIEAQTKFHLAPTWDTEDWTKARRPYQPELYGYTNVDIRGFAMAVEPEWGYVWTGGKEALTLLSASVPINWTDEDGDGQNDTGTAVVPGITSAVQACEIEIFYPGHDGDPEWQIRPARATIAGGIATITFYRELAVAENVLFSRLDPGPAVWTDDADFLSSVDVYRHYNDPSQQAILMWEPTGCPTCGGSGCTLCSYSVQDGCVHLKSTPKMAILGVSPGTYNTTTNQFDPSELSVGRTPDIVRLNYYSGWQAKRGCVNVIDDSWARPVAYLACGLLDRPLCDCTANVWKHWREDMSLLNGGDDQTSTYSFDTRKAAGECPFGTTRGALYAWRRVNDPDVVRVDSAVLV